MTVDAGVTTDIAGNLNTAASNVLKYRPPSHAVSSVQKTANAVVATSLAASVAAGLLSGEIMIHIPCQCDLSCMFHDEQFSSCAIVTYHLACFTTIYSPCHCDLSSCLACFKTITSPSMPL